MNKLREATKELHEQIEKENLAALIIDHSINLEEYKLLLLQNFIAYAVVEKEISTHLEGYEGTKHLALEKDLQALEVDASLPLAFFQDHFRIKNRSEALGATYVVEGSALGGMLIAKELKECQDLRHLEKHNFFNGDRNNVKGWNKFQKQLKAENFTSQQELKMIEKAKETFRFFGEVFRLEGQPRFS